MFRIGFVTLLLSTVTLAAASPAQPAALAPLFNHVWRITSPKSFPDSGSIYVFLPNGTLLETSCVETYRVATWKSVGKDPGKIEVTEDGRPAFRASILPADGARLHLRQTMALGNRIVRDLSFVAIDKEFVCPDMPR